MTDSIKEQFAKLLKHVYIQDNQGNQENQDNRGNQDNQGNQDAGRSKRGTKVSGERVKTSPLERVKEVPLAAGEKPDRIGQNRTEQSQRSTPSGHYADSTRVRKEHSTRVRKEHSTRVRKEDLVVMDPDLMRDYQPEKQVSFAVPG